MSLVRKNPRRPSSDEPTRSLDVAQAAFEANGFRVREREAPQEHVFTLVYQPPGAFDVGAKIFVSYLDTARPVLDFITVPRDQRHKGFGTRVLRSFNMALSEAGYTSYSFQCADGGQAGDDAAAFWTKVLAKEVNPGDVVEVHLQKRAKENPFSVSRRDLEDAIKHADVYGDQGWTVEDFDVEDLGKISLRKLREFDGVDAWLDVSAEDFKGLSTEDRLEQLKSFRGPQWAERAAKWVKDGVPPIVVIEAPTESDATDVPMHVQIGDGRGRVNFAVALGLKSVPVVYMRYRGLKENPLPQNFEPPDLETLYRSLCSLIGVSVQRAAQANATCPFSREDVENFVVYCTDAMKAAPSPELVFSSWSKKGWPKGLFLRGGHIEAHGTVIPGNVEMTASVTQLTDEERVKKDGTVEYYQHPDLDDLRASSEWEEYRPEAGRANFYYLGEPPWQRPRHLPRKNP